MADIPFPTIRNRKLAEKLKNTIAAAHTEAVASGNTRVSFVCTTHGEQKTPMRLRENQYHCPACLADMLDNMGGKLTVNVVPT